MRRSTTERRTVVRHLTIGRLGRTLLACMLATAVVMNILPSAAQAAEPGLTIEKPAPSLTMGEIARMGDDPISGTAPVRVLVVSNARGDITWDEFSRLANGQPVSGVTVVRPAANVAPSTTVDNLTNGEPATVARRCGPVCQRILDILATIVIIIIIIIL
jgi:hypothetical protein